MSINIVLIHKFKALENYIFYDKVIESVIENVSKFNNIKYKGKTCKVYFIGNMHHKNLVEKFGVEFISLKKYPLNNFIYKTHISSNPKLYEYFCFKRHLILWKFLNEYKLDNLIYLDSDVMVLNHKKFLDTFYQPEKDIVAQGHTVVPCFLYLSKRGLNYVKTAIINFFKMNSEEILNYLYELPSGHNYKKNNQFSDMHFLTELFLGYGHFKKDFGSNLKLSTQFINNMEFVSNFSRLLPDNHDTHIVFNKENKNWYMKNNFIKKELKDKIEGEYFLVNALHLAGSGKVFAEYICNLYRDKKTMYFENEFIIDNLLINEMYKG
jgi:sRNA-binding regulator protein Hfq